MKIFVSWSGEKSKSVASALKEWLPDLVQHVEVFMSEHDLDAGSRWSTELSSRLEACTFGIICVTAENISAPWLLFEAGCLDKSVNRSRVVPYRVGISAPDVPFPLAQFQSVGADREGTLKLLKSIVAASSGPLDENRINRLFERLWPDLEKRLKLAEVPATSVRQRSERELLDELVQLIRGVAQTSNSILSRIGDLPKGESSRLPNGAKPLSRMIEDDPSAQFGTHGEPFTSLYETRRMLADTLISHSIRIDPSALLGVNAEPFTIPYDPTQSVSAFLNMVWRELNGKGDVAPWTWGDRWMLSDEQTGKILDHIGIEFSRSRGEILDDRPINVVGIKPQMSLRAHPYHGKQQSAENKGTES
jgi:hypothetical protein